MTARGERKRKDEVGRKPSRVERTIADNDLPIERWENEGGFVRDPTDDTTIRKRPR